MNKPILFAMLASGLAVLPLPAKVTLTFDSDLQGVVADADATSVTWSNYGGGCLAYVTTGNWKVSCARIDLNAAGMELLKDEYVKALANGGTISFKVTLETDGVPAGENPGWFETTLISNTDGVWDQLFGGGKGLTQYGGFPLAAAKVVEISLPIEAASSAVDDAIMQANPNSGWRELRFGLNSQDTLTSARIYLDDIAITANEAPGPPIIPKLTIEKAARGLNLLAAGSGQYERRMVRTTGPAPACSWVGAATVANPVTYSFTLAEFPQDTSFNALLYFLPGTDLTELTDPDWQHPTVARMSVSRTTAGGPTSGSEFTYKVNSPNSNGPAGNEYWVADTVPSSGLGGRLARVDAGNPLGQWKLTFTSDTDFTITAPDGTTASGSMLPATAALFAGNLYVYLAIVPGQPGSIGGQAVFSNLSVAGVAGAFSENFEVPLADGPKHVSATPATRTGVNVVTEFDPYWIQWTLPATDYKLMHGPDLGAVQPWMALDMTKAITIPGKVRYLFNTGDAADFDIGFFRMEKPAPPPPAL